MSKDYHLLESMNVSSILNFYKSIEPSIKWQHGEKGKQSSLQYAIDEEPFISGCGKTSGMDKSNNILVDIYHNTIVDNIIQKYKMVRTRWMWMSPFSCYSIHRDVYPRIHIPIITNDRCYFLFPNREENIIFNLPSTGVWWVNTRIEHTFLNCSDIWRLHLVGSCLL